MHQPPKTRGTVFEPTGGAYRTASARWHKKGTPDPEADRMTNGGYVAPRAAFPNQPQH